MRILLTGAGGQLATDLHAVFAEAGHAVTAHRRQSLDIADQDAVRAAVEETGPDLILNPAAYNRVDEAERESELAFAVNALGPLHLARAAEERGALMVHYSTDYVMDGPDGVPLGESDLPRPLSAYAASKLAGEHLVAAYCARYYVVRVCGLFGQGGRSSRHGNFVETMLRLADAGRQIRVVADQVVAPTSSLDVARATLQMVQLGVAPGLYHCTAEGETSWYDYARAIFELAGVKAQLSATTAAEYGAAARRPSYSVLDNAKLEATGVARPRQWRTALNEYLALRRG
jgi:dTDP-4-dehydrorhamnose reductase